MRGRARLAHRPAPPPAGRRTQRPPGAGLANACVPPEGEPCEDKGRNWRNREQPRSCHREPRQGPYTAACKALARLGVTSDGRMIMANDTMLKQMSDKGGFVAALDQSGGSTPGAL